MKRLILLLLVLSFAAACYGQIGAASNLRRYVSDPPCFAPGQIWYNTTSNLVKICNGSLAVVVLGGSGSVTPSGTLTLNHLALGGGTTVVKVDTACVTDGAGAISGCVSINAASLSTGTAPTALGNATGGMAATCSTAGTSAAVAGQGYIRCDTTTGFWVIRHVNGANEVSLGTAYTLVSSGSIGSLSVTNGPSQIITCTATCSLTPLTPPAAGYQLCVVMAAGVTGTITLNALGNSAMYGKTDGSAYGTAGTGTAVSTSTTGNRICVVGRDATHYETPAFQGTFTMN